MICNKRSMVPGSPPSSIRAASALDPIDADLLAPLPAWDGGSYSYSGIDNTGEGSAAYGAKSKWQSTSYDDTYQDNTSTTALPTHVIRLHRTGSFEVERLGENKTFLSPSRGTSPKQQSVKVAESHVGSTPHGVVRERAFHFDEEEEFWRQRRDNLRAMSAGAEMHRTAEGDMHYNSVSNVETRNSNIQPPPSPTARSPVHVRGTQPSPRSTPRTTLRGRSREQFTEPHNLDNMAKHPGDLFGSFAEEERSPEPRMFRTASASPPRRIRGQSRGESVVRVHMTGQPDKRSNGENRAGADMMLRSLIPQLSEVTALMAEGLNNDTVTDDMQILDRINKTRVKVSAPPVPLSTSGTMPQTTDLSCATVEATFDHHCRLLMRSCIDALELARRRHKQSLEQFQEQISAVQRAGQRGVRQERARAAAALQELEKHETEVQSKADAAVKSLKAQIAALEKQKAEEHEKFEKEKAELRTAIQQAHAGVETALQKQREEAKKKAAQDVEAMRKAVDQLREQTGIERQALRKEMSNAVAEVQSSAEAQVAIWRSKAAAAVDRAVSLSTYTQQEKAENALKDTQSRNREIISEQVTADLASMKATHASAAQRWERREKELLEELQSLQEEHRGCDKKMQIALQKQATELSQSWEAKMAETNEQWQAKVSFAEARARRQAAESLRGVNAAHDAEMMRVGREIVTLQKQLRRSQLEQRDTFGTTAKALNKREQDSQERGLQDRQQERSLHCTSINLQDPGERSPARGAYSSPVQYHFEGSRKKLLADTGAALSGVAAEGLDLTADSFTKHVPRDTYERGQSDQENERRD